MQALFLWLIAAVLLVSGCSTTLTPHEIDTSGKFPTSSKLSADSVKTIKPFAEKYKTLAYIKTDDSKVKKYNEFFVESFNNMKVFSKVVQKSDLESLVLERKLTDKVSNISDLIGLNQLQKQMGPFLVIEPYVEWKGGYNFFAQLKAVDPETGETVLLLEQNAFNWAGLDDPLFFPLLNGFLQWAKGETITTEPKTTESKPE